MADKKKKRYKNAYLNDFKVNDDGKYEYKGKHYSCTDSENSKRKKHIALLVLSLSVFVLLAVAGCLPAVGSGSSFYVIIPYVISVFFSGFLIYCTVKLLISKEPLREYIYKKTVVRIPYLSLVSAVACTVTAVCETVFVSINGFGGKAVNTVIYIVLAAVCSVLSLLLRNTFLGLHWIETVSSLKEE